MSVPEPAAPSQVAIVINPASGKGEGRNLQEEICAELDSRGCNVTVLEVSKEQGPEECARQAVEQGAELVFLCGGDGTVSGGLAGMADNKQGARAALIPAGTGNLLAHNLDLMRPLPELIRIAFEGEPMPMDLLRIHARDRTYHACVMSGAGFDARIIEGADSTAKKQWGVIAYISSALRNFQPRAFRMQILRHGERPIRCWASSLILANVGHLQGGIALFPEARPDDGLLDMAVVRASGLPEWLRIFWNVLRRRLNAEPAVDLYRAKQLEVRFLRPQPFQCDGEALGRVRSFTVEVRPGAVKVMVPPAEATPAAASPTQEAIAT